MTKLFYKACACCGTSFVGTQKARFCAPCRRKKHGKILVLKKCVVCGKMAEIDIRSLCCSPKCKKIYCRKQSAEYFKNYIPGQNGFPKTAFLFLKNDKWYWKDEKTKLSNGPFETIKAAKKDAREALY